MAEYIERETLIEILDNDGVIDGFTFSDGETLLQKINSVPASNVEPIIYAKWDMVEEERFWIQNMQESLETGKPTKAKLPVCSHCKTKFGTLVLDFKRCPECGAIMSKEQGI